MAGKFEGKGKVNRLPSVRALAIQTVRSLFLLFGVGLTASKVGASCMNFAVRRYIVRTFFAI